MHPIFFVVSLLIIQYFSPVSSFVPNKTRAVVISSYKSSSLKKHQLTAQDFDSIVESRYACTRFQRHDGTHSLSSESKTPSASESDPTVVNLAYEALDVSRRAPSGFNTQPYRLIMVDTKSKKEELAKYCLGRNADRVRDSDCTAVFLADKECLREYKRFDKFLDSSSDHRRKNSGRKKSLSKWAKRKMQAIILLFSSGWPLPRILSNPISFAVRLGVSSISAISRRKILLPSLSSAETWASKNTMLVAMTYMLACSSRGLATTPMEGYNVGGIRKALGIPKRYAIPIIVSTGLPYQREKEEEGYDDVGMGHGPKTSSDGGSTLRYPMEEVIFHNGFG